MAKHCKYRIRQIENVAENGFLEVPLIVLHNELPLIFHSVTAKITAWLAPVILCCVAFATVLK